MTPDQALWEDELARAVQDLANAERYDDYGAIEWHKTRIHWAQMKIREYEEYEKNRRGA